MTTSLLHRYAHGAPPPAPAVVAEGRGWGLDVKDPGAEHRELVAEFVDAYCRDAAPASVLLVSPHPGIGGALHTGIPFTDGVAAARHLHLAAPIPQDAAPDPLSARFWDAVTDARRATRGTLEGLFANVQLTHAFPYALVNGQGAQPIEKYLPSLPHYRRACQARFAEAIAALRPSVIGCVGRLAYEAVASVADNRLALAGRLAESGWGSLADGRMGSRGEFARFRSRLVPLPGLDESVANGRARSALATFLADAWA